MRAWDEGTVRENAGPLINVTMSETTRVEITTADTRAHEHEGDCIDTSQKEWTLGPKQIHPGRTFKTSAQKRQHFYAYQGHLSTELLVAANVRRLFAPGRPHYLGFDIASFTE